MVSASASCSLLLLWMLLILQCGNGINAQWITKEERNEAEKEDGLQKYFTNDHPKTNKADMDPSFNVFFKLKDLHKGYTMPVYFAKKDLAKSPHLLPRDESDSIPFSSSKLDYILSLFSFPKYTPQAKAIEYTLRQCEMKSEGKEIMFCVSSLESMLDLTQNVLGLNTKFDVITSITHPSKTTPLLQNYTFAETPHEIQSHKMVACHPMPYPYAVFYCHGHVDGTTKVYKFPLIGENGDKVDAVAVCHMNTSTWDKTHASFKMLNMEPGSGPVCHFIPHDNFVWLPSAALKL